MVNGQWLMDDVAENNDGIVSILFMNHVPSPINHHPLTITHCRRVMAREIITLACGACKRRNYTTTKDKKLTPDRIELKKYCRFERKHTVHREIR